MTKRILKTGKVEKGEQINPMISVKREYNIYGLADTGPRNPIEANQLLVLKNNPEKISMDSDDKTLFELLQSPEGWKYPTKAIKVATLPEAQKVADALTFYAGGAEILEVLDGLIVSSRGYYHYVGA